MNHMSKKSSSHRFRINEMTIFVILAVAFTLYMVLGRANIENTMAYSDQLELWQEFREKNPNNYQTVGIKAYEDKSYNIILSEPSPSLSLEKLESFIEKYHGIVFTHTCPMGIDGWLKDAVLCFNGVRKYKMPEFRSELFNLLYGTDYKAAFEDLSEIAGHTDFLKENINYQISAEELQKWFIDDGQLLIENGSNNEYSLEDLLNKELNGIYYTKEPGMVVWILNLYDDTPGDFDVPARMFALDSDLILGAVGKGNTVAIIGGERQLPLHELPPMRVETMKLLASTSKAELSQSYERNNIVAGKMTNGKDFAPIYLSPELWHTEYGSMLNVTDQMLKSWSENGEIEYESFVYSKPYDWAFVESAMRNLNVSELTYNWNTSGAGYSIDADDNNPYSVYALNRTGSLPVSYIPGDTDEITEDDKVYQAEENAYDFFSGLASPELTKVLEYTALYQIFKHYGYHLAYEPDSYAISTYSADNAIKESLFNISQFGDSEKEIVRDNVKQEFIDKEEELKTLRSIPFEKRTSEQNSRIETLFLLQILIDPEEVANETIAMFDSLKESVNSYGDILLFSRISHYLVNTRDIDYGALSELVSDDEAEVSDDLAAQYYAFLLMENIEKIEQYNHHFHLYDLMKIRNGYIEDNRESHSNWIKCPTVVQSWSIRDSINLVGGHNLDSRITPVKIDNSLKRGQCLVEKLEDGSKVIRISPFDKGQITPSFLRNVERTGKVGKQIFSSEARSPRAFADVFPTQTRATRGFDPANQISRVMREKDGFSVNGKITKDVDTFWKELAEAPKDEGTPVHQIVFENFSQDEVRMIMDDSPAVIINKGSASRASMSDFDFQHIKISEADADGNIVVSIPKKSKSIIVTDGQDKRVIPIQSASMEIQFPEHSKNGWLKTLKQMFADPNGEWSLFRFKRAGKKNGLNPEETKELVRYQFARNHIIPNRSSDVFIIQPQAA